MEYEISPLLTKAEFDKARDFRMSIRELPLSLNLNSIYDEAPASSSKLPFGAVAKVEGRIVGVIFFVLQGNELPGSNSSRPIVNLSTFYVEEEHRGFLSFMMFKKALKMLDGAVVTNYTPTFEMEKICTLLGFTQQSSVWNVLIPVRFLALPEALRLKSELLNKHSHASAQNPDIQYTFRKSPRMEIYRLVDKSGGESVVWGMDRFYTRNFLGIKIRVKCHWIMAITGEGDTQRAASIVMWKKLIKDRALITIVATEPADRPSMSFGLKSSWLMRCPGAENTRKFYPPIGSEHGL